MHGERRGTDLPNGDIVLEQNTGEVSGNERPEVRVGMDLTLYWLAQYAARSPSPA